MKSVFTFLVFFSLNAYGAENVTLQFSEEKGLTAPETCVIDLVLDAVVAQDKNLYNSPFMLTSQDKTKAYHAVYVGEPNEISAYTLVFVSTSDEGWSGAHIVKPVRTKEMSDEVEIFKGSEERVGVINVEACF